MYRTTVIPKRIKTAIIATCLLSAAALSLPRFPGTAAQSRSALYLVFGPADFIRGTDKPQIETRNFAARQSGSDYLLRISNGGRNGEFNRVSSARVVLNQQVIVFPRDFNQQAQVIERRVRLEVNNTLSVKVESAPGSGLTIEIYGSDYEPPSLTLTSPEDQAVVEANTVTLVGAASDSLSGVDQVTCNGVPAALSGVDFSCAVGLAEGFNAIEVRASDRAGNVASRNLTVTSVTPRPIGPDGGTIAALGGRVRLVIPPGALRQAVPLTVRPLPSPPGDPLGDTLFEFGPDGTRFLQPVELTLAYDPAAVSPDQVVSLRIARLLPDGTLRLTPPGEIDTESHTVTAEIHGFSSYTITLQCGDPAAVCIAPPTLAAEYMENRTINLSWTYTPQHLANYVALERAVVRGGAPCTAGEAFCICDDDGCRLNGLQPPHDADYTHIATRSSSITSFTDSGIAPDSAFYWYRIRWSSSLVSHPSEPAKVFVIGLLDPPPDPDTLTTLPLSCGGIGLTWSPVSEAEAYLIERAGPDGVYQQVAVVPSPDIILFTDTTPMTEGVAYTYLVRSLAGSLMSPGRRAATAIAPPPCGGSIRIELTTYAEHLRRNAAWVGVREGAGPWRRVGGTDGTYGFEVTDFAGAERYSVAVVCLDGLRTEGHLLELTTDDPRSFSVTCGRVSESRGSLLAVEAYNVPAGTCVTGAAGSHLSTGACSPYGWGVSVFPGIYDLVTLARNSSTSAVGRISIERDLSVTGSTSLGVDLGTAAAAESHQISVAGASGPIATSVNLLTAGGTRALLGFGGTTTSYGGLPNAAQLTGDIHRASVVSTTERRSVHAYFKTPADVFVDFSALPASLPNPTVQIAARSPRLRIETDFQARAAALPDAVGNVILYQHFNAATDSSRTWRVFLSGRWLTGQPQVYELPDFRSAPDWQSVWELPNTAPTINWTFTTYTTNGETSTFVQSLYTPLNQEGRVLPHGFVRREFSVSGAVQ